MGPVRREWLEQIERDLSSEEWRELQIILSRRTFQFDIIGNLPVELAALVFSFVDIGAVSACLRVSKYWQSLFYQSIVQDATLAQWFCPDDLPLCGEHHPWHMKLSRLERFKVKVDHVSSFLAAKPRTCFVRTFDNSSASLASNMDSQIHFCHYDHGALAYTEKDPAYTHWRSTTLRTYDFRSGEEQILRTEGHEIILATTVTRDYIGYVTITGDCYAYSRSASTTTSRASSITLPSAAIRGFSGRDGFLSVLMRDTILVWTPASGSLRSFDIPAILFSSCESSSLEFSRVLHTQHVVAKDGLSIFLFLLSSASEDPSGPPGDVLHVCKLFQDEEHLLVDSLTTASRHGLDHPRSTYSPRGAARCGRRRFSICATTMAGDDDSESTLDIIVFDEDDEKLYQYKTEGVDPNNGLAMWKDTCITSNSHGKRPELLFMRGGETHEVELSSNYFAHRSLVSGLQIMADETVVVIIEPHQSGKIWRVRGLIFDQHAHNFGVFETLGVGSFRTQELEDINHDRDPLRSISPEHNLTLSDVMGVRADWI